MTTVITAMYGDHDALRPQAEQDVAVDWLCFTDVSSLQREIPGPWTVADRHDDGLHPNLAAKRFKVLPHQACDDPDVVWIDASMEITSPAFAREALAARSNGVAAWKHPRRDCIYDEADASVGHEGGHKYADVPIREQAEHYQRAGHPPHWGLWACGTVAWDTSDARIRAFGELWWSECVRWTYQDQLSFPVVARQLGLRPGSFPIRQIERRATRRPWLENRWLRIHPHL